MATRKSILELLREGGYDIAGGNGIPLEEIYASNTITKEEYKREVEHQRMLSQRDGGSTASSVAELGDEVLRKRAVGAGVPRRFLDYPVDLSRIDDLREGRGVYIFGRQGAHKTTVACSMLRGWLKENPFGVAKFVRSTTLVDDFNDTYSTRETIAHVMAQYASVGLLLIDDLGKEVPTARAVSRLWELIDRRYGEMVPTIITSQFRPDGLAQNLSDGGGAESALAIMRRLQETFALLNMGE